MKARWRAVILVCAVLGIGAVGWLVVERIRGPATVSHDSDGTSDAQVPPVRSDVAKAQGSGLHVLLISVDTLRHDHLSLYGYERETSPELDSFFEKAEVYERAYSAEATTTPSVVTMLTGLYPQRHGVRLLYQMLDRELVTLPGLLKKAGYQTAGVVSNIVLTGEACGLDEHFDYYDDFVDEREMNRDVFERNAERTTNAALKWLESEKADETPHFLWVHYIDPHGPYNPPEGKPSDFTHENARPIDLSKVKDYQEYEGVDDGREYVDRYDEEIAYVDREIGRLLRKYQAGGHMDRALVIFTSDHGETMMRYDRHFTHGYHVWEPIMRVPLMVRYPGVKPRRVEKVVSLADIVPTVLDHLDLDAPGPLDGYALSERPAASIVSLEASSAKYQERAVVSGTQKWLATISPEGKVTERRFTDLAKHPFDHPLSQSWPDGAGAEVLASLIETDPDVAGKPEDLVKGKKLDGPKVAPGRTPKQLEALRALGYVE